MAPYQTAVDRNGNDRYPPRGAPDGPTPQHVVERKDGKTGSGVLYVRALVVVVVGVDVRFFRNRSWERAIVNVGIVPVFAVFYLRFLKHP